MQKGSLQQKHGTWYVVVNHKDEFGKPKQKWITTNLRVNNNKTIAKQEIKKILKEQSAFSWIIGIFKDRDYENLDELSYDKEFHRL